MQYAIVYSSRTGNTRLLADTVRQALDPADCLYFGPPDPAALAAGCLYLGFWTDKGSCDEQTARFLSQLTNQRVFLFGTAGFGGAQQYFDGILDRVRGQLPDTVTVTGSFLCQGKMPPSVRARYESMPESPRRNAMIENFDRALSHPDAADLAGLKAALGGAQ